MLQATWVTMNFVPFGEKALRLLVTLYHWTASETIVMQRQVLHKVIKVRGG